MDTRDYDTFIVDISGGKDSTAVTLWTLQIFVDFILYCGILIVEINMFIFLHFLVALLVGVGVHFIFEVPPAQAAIIGLLALIIFLLLDTKD